MKEEYKKYRKKWDRIPHEFVQEKVPLHLDLEVTTRCNYECIMCLHSFDPPEPMDLDRELMRKIIKEFAEKGGKAIKFCYLGEPLLYPYLIEAIKYAKELGIVDTRLATNGSLLTERLCKDLIKSGLDLIIFSVDSIHPEVYASIRVGGNLRTVIRNLHTFRRIRNWLASTTPSILIQAIPLEQNMEELDSLEYYNFYIQYADAIWRSPWCNDYTGLPIQGPNPNFRCPAPFRRLTVRVNGDICICCGSREDTKILGNLEQMTLEQAWESLFIKKVRKYLDDGNAHLISPCRECEERYYKRDKK